MADSLESKVIKSLEEGYSEDEIVKAMEMDGYDERKIRKVVAQAEEDMEAGQSGTSVSLGSGPEKEASTGEDSASNQENKDGESRSFGLMMALAFIFPPAMYYMLGKTKLTIVNLLTANFIGLGVLICPIHCYRILSG